ncbi:MAG: DUF559 domain-containing protein [Terrimesophilobacter sp.]
MARIEADIRRLGGFAKAAELLASGHSPEMIRAAVVAGHILRVRKGWYANIDVSQDVVRAFRVGGILSCLSGAVHHGLWVPEHSGLHVSLPRRASRLRTSHDFRKRLSSHPEEDVVLHWGREDPVGSRQVAAVAECVVQAFACHGTESGFVLLESALRNGRLRSSEIPDVLHGLSLQHRKLAHRATDESDSGTESIAKLHLIALGILFVQQAFVGGVGPLDFLIGERLVMEIDSREFHSDPYRDRHKDAELSFRGCRVLRFMYSQVVYEWPDVERSILAAISRGDHHAA